MGLFVGILVLFAVGWFVFSYLNNRERLIKNRIKALPLSTVAEASEMDLRLSGTVQYIEGGRTLVAPLSQRPCAAWRVVVQEKRGSGKNSHWVEVLAVDDNASFLLKDETGVAIVDGQGLMTVALKADDKGGSAFFSGTPPELTALLQENGVETKGLFFNKAFRYQEGILEAGEIVTVAGGGRWEHDPARKGDGYRNSAKRLRVEAMSDGTLLVTDDPKLA